MVTCDLLDLQEFLDVRDADDARYYTNGKDLDGSRLIVEFARRVSIMYFFNHLICKTIILFLA